MRISTHTKGDCGEPWEVKLRVPWGQGKEGVDDSDAGDVVVEHSRLGGRRPSSSRPSSHGRRRIRYSLDFSHLLLHYALRRLYFLDRQSVPVRR